MRWFNETPDTSESFEWVSFYVLMLVFYWDNLMRLDGPWQKDRWETGLFMSCPVSSGAPWVVIMIVFWPTLGGVGLDTSLRQGKGHPWWSLFSKLVHRHDKNKIWITDAVIKPPPFQSQCQSWNKSVGLLLCLNFPELNPNNSLFWNIWLQSAQTKLWLYTPAFQSVCVPLFESTHQKH